MSSETRSDFPLEIGHVLFVDIVGYSKLLINEQSELLEHLKEMVRGSEQVRCAEAEGKLIRLATGDGMALVFRTNPEAPVQCALELARADKEHPELRLRMGIHSGPINQVTDLNDRANVTGAGINMAQRVMDCGDAGHILLSQRVAGDLAQYRHWQPFLHELGECEVKHGVRLSVVNLYTDELGNRELPEKFKKLTEQGVASSRTGRRGGPWRVVIIALCLLGATAAGVMLFRAWRAPPAAQEAKVAPPAVVLDEKSIAVLPFENLSAEREDAFFADGIQDDVLTSLAKVKDLTVIARASVLPYRGEAASGKLREIGQTLRVAHILQGSVRRVANHVVVNVQLVDARTDRQIWAERYDRTMTDTLSLQGELAIEIARELRATLTPREQRAFARKPTENPEAYVAYLRARELETRFLASDADVQAAKQFYEKAIALDPTFALARARLSLTGLLIGSTPESDAINLAQAQEALRLNPNLGEGHLALASYYHSRGEPEPALVELTRAEELLPNSPEVWEMRASIYRGQGRLRERIAALQRAEILDPRAILNARLAHTYEYVRQWQDAIRICERVKALVPGDDRPDGAIARMKFRQSGLLEPLREFVSGDLKGVPPEEVALERYQLAVLERDYPAAERLLRDLSAEWPELAFGHSRSVNEALLAVARGAEAGTVESALVAARAETEKLLAADPENFKLHGELGLIDALRGRKEDAIREGRRWFELEETSTLEKNAAEANLALIYARVGEPDKAIELIEKLITLPSNLVTMWDSCMTQADLKWRWVWDPLRSDPRFKKILEGPEPKTVY